MPCVSASASTRSACCSLPACRLLLGIMARARFPELIDSPNLALPMVFMYGLPPLAGAVALAAVFSAEVSAADAVLFMLTTSLSQDLYKRFLNPAADDARVLAVARLATLVSGALGVGLALFSEDLVQTLSIFYALLGVSLFVPVIAGLYVRRANTDAALWRRSSAASAACWSCRAPRAAPDSGWLGPAPAGLLCAVAGMGRSRLRSRRNRRATAADTRPRPSGSRASRCPDKRRRCMLFCFGCISRKDVMSSRTYKIAILAGDGIGKEVVPAGLAAIEAAIKGTGITIDWTELPWGCDYYLEKGRMMDEDGFERAAKFDAIYLGAIGSPKVPDHIAVWDLLLPLRQRFQQYVNLRPMRLLPGLTSPLANRTSADIDMVCVRENSEGEYSGVGGRIHVGTPHEVAEQTGRLHPRRHRADRALRIRGGVEAAAQDAGERDQVECAAARDGAVGRSRRDRGEGLSAGRATASTTWTRIAARMVTNPADRST